MSRKWVMTPILGLVLLVLLAACGSSNSGIQGTVMLGPTCPVERQGQSCPDKPLSTSIIITNQRGRTVKTVQSGKDGQFRVALRPGVYTLKVVRQGPMPGSTQTVTVRQDAFTQVQLRVDSGIR